MECRMLTNGKRIEFVGLAVVTAVLPLCGCALGQASDHIVPRSAKSLETPYAGSEARGTTATINRTDTTSQITAKSRLLFGASQTRRPRSYIRSGHPSATRHRLLTRSRCLRRRPIHEAQRKTAGPGFRNFMLRNRRLAYRDPLNQKLSLRAGRISRRCSRPTAPRLSNKCCNPRPRCWSISMPSGVAPAKRWLPYSMNWRRKPRRHESSKWTSTTARKLLPAIESSPFPACWCSKTGELPHSTMA